MDEVAQICDRVLFLDRGKIAAVGRPDELAASAAATRIRLRVVHGLDDLLRHAAQRGLPARSEDGMVEVEIDEHEIAELPGGTGLVECPVHRDLAIEKPTLEDYFLKLARQGAAGCEPDEWPRAARGRRAERRKRTR